MIGRRPCRGGCSLLLVMHDGWRRCPRPPVYLFARYHEACGFLRFFCMLERIKARGRSELARGFLKQILARVLHHGKRCQQRYQQFGGCHSFLVGQCSRYNRDHRSCRRCTGASACKCCTGASGGPFSASATATCGTAAAISGESASRRARGHKVPSSVQLLWRGELLARGSVHQ